MMLSKKVLATTTGLITAAVLFLCGSARMIWPGYADAFLQIFASVYPGFDGGSCIWQVIIGTVYGFIDGFIGGWIFAWLYNRLSRPGATTAG